MKTAASAAAAPPRGLRCIAMPRKGEVKRRDVLPDPKYHDRTVTKFVASMMQRREEELGRAHLLRRARPRGRARRRKTRSAVFKRALDQVKPMVEVRSRRVGGANYQVPVEVAPARVASSLAHALAHPERARPSREVDGAEARRRDPRRGAGPRRRRSRRRKTRTGWPRPTRPSPITAGRRVGTPIHASSRTTRAHSEHRHHGPHRCRQDHDDRAHPLLHRHQPQDRRGARRRRDHGLDGAGAGARHHHHVGRHHVLLARPPRQHHRHAGPRRLHDRGRAEPPRARRRGRGVLRRRRRRAAVRDRVAPGGSLPGPAPRVRQQDGPRRRRLRARGRPDPRAAEREPGRAPAAARRGREAPRRRSTSSR